MKVKRLIAIVLVAATLCGLMTALPVSAAGFTDISGPAVAEAAELLRLLGVVDGTGGTSFSPNGYLTRAQFCKMAIEIRGEGNKAAAQMNRTIFMDVTGTHWARGYVNYASSITVGSGEGAAAEKLIMGVGDGTFRPDSNITAAQAVTMVMRLLNYTAADVTAGATWYDGYLGTAGTIGLLNGLTLSPDAPLTRGQAAVLFENLLFTPVKDSQSTYFESVLGGKVTADTVVLGYTASGNNGKPGVYVAGQETAVPTALTALSSQLVGVRGEMLQDRDGQFLTLRPASEDTIRRVTLTATPVTDRLVAGSETIPVQSTTPVYQGTKQSTFSESMKKLYSGTNLVLCYGPDGLLDYICVASGTGTSTAGGAALVARTDPNGRNPFTSLTGGESSYQIFKNGTPASVSDLRQYDVAVYDAASKILQVSDLRLTGIFENAAPNLTLPTSVTMMGQTFPVLPEAATDLASFKVGSTITLLLTVNGEVAGVVSPAEARSTVVGVASVEGDSATVTPLVSIPGPDGPRTFSGKHGLTSDASKSAIDGQIVTISSYRRDQITLSRVQSSGAGGALDLEGGTVGTTALAPNVRLFEKVGTSPLAEINPSQITVDTVPASDIAYVHRDYAGRIDVVVLEDVTGDLYTYGYLLKGQTTESFGSGEGSTTFHNTTVVVQNSDTPNAQPSTTGPLTGFAFTDRQPGGIVLSSSKTSDGAEKVASLVTLTEARNVAASLFNMTDHYLTLNGKRYPISQQVQCYYQTTGTWFNTEGSDGWAALETALNYADTLTVYYDRAPEQGGKIRMVVVG